MGKSINFTEQPLTKRTKRVGTVAFYDVFYDNQPVDNILK